MARSPAQTVREVLPESRSSIAGAGERVAPTSVQASAAFASPDSRLAIPNRSGAIIARGLEEAGEGFSRLGAFYNDAAADDATNRYQDEVNRIMHGGVGPDGKQVPGFMSLKGRDAIEAAPKVREDIDKLLNKLSDGLRAPAAAKKFSDYSRRFRAITNAQIGQHTDRAYQTWMTGVNKASEKLAIDHISNNAGNDEEFLHGTSDLVSARVKQAQLVYGNDPAVINAAVQTAKQDALEARLNVVAVDDPARAIRILEANKSTMGAKYDNVYAKYRARADQQIGREAADSILGAQPLENGEDVKSVLRHFEGFKNRAYEDRSPGAPTAWRVGYGSDTVTRADGKVEKVGPDTVVTREDAERDLERRAALSQNDARKAIGEEAWSQLDGKAKASLTSIAYNYGKLPEAVAAAARSGDKEKIAQAIESLSGHNAGINVRRRMQEAANVRGGNTAPANQAEAIDQVLNDPVLKERPEAQAAAIARINKSYALQQKEQTIQKAAFETRVKDARAEALTTGELTSPIPEADFLKQYGPIDGPNKYAEYTADVEYGAKYKAMQSMSAVEINQMVDKAVPAPGTPGYAYAIQKHDRLQKGAAALIKERREDPAGAVSRMPAVQEVYSKLDPKDPGSIRALSAARMAAQENLGIEPEYRSPITKAEALQFTIPIATMLPGQERDTITKVAKQFVAMFGDDAEQAFSYALRARKVDAEQAQIAGRLAKKMAIGEPLTAADAAAIDAGRDAAAASEAVQAGTPGGPPVRPQRAQPRVIGNPEEPDPTNPGQAMRTKVPGPNDISFLLRNPGTEKQFDEKFGRPGMAKEILKRYGGAVGAGAGGGGGG